VTVAVIFNKIEPYIFSNNETLKCVKKEKRKGSVKNIPLLCSNKGISS